MDYYYCIDYSVAGIVVDADVGAVVVANVVWLAMMWSVGQLMLVAVL